MTDNNELEVLKAQMEVLREKLSNDEIVSEEMFRATIETRTKNLDNKRSDYLLGLVVTILMGALLAFQFTKGIYSLKFMIITIAWILLFAILNIIGYCRNSHENLMGESLVKTAENIAAWRKHKGIEGIVKTCAIAIWLPACLIEIWDGISTSPSHITFVILVITVVLFSAIRKHVRTMKSSKAMIEQIEDISASQR